VKRFLALFAALAWISVFSTACGGKSAATQIPDTTAAALPSTKIRVGVEAPFPPFEVIATGKQELTGFDVELMRAVAARAGLAAEFVKVGKNQLLTDVLNCRYDAGISAIPITDVLRQQIVFSDPYLTLGQVVVVKKGNIEISDRDALSGMTVGAQKNSPSAIAVQDIPGAKSLPYPTLDLAFQDLIAGYIDAVVANKPRALTYTAIPANNLKIVGDEFGSESLGIAICKQNAGLLKKINDGLADIKADGTLDKLTRQFFGNSPAR
jgi:polar amino acid transport system substrate-binding protein